MTSIQVAEKLARLTIENDGLKEECKRLQAEVGRLKKEVLDTAKEWVLLQDRDDWVERGLKADVDNERLRHELDEWVKVGAEVLASVENMEKIIQEIKES